jgi:reprolysin-like metallo-peptidase family M12B
VLVVAVIPTVALASSSAAGSAGAPASPVSTPDPVWTSAGARPATSHDGHRRAISPSDYRAYTLDTDGLAVALAAAPMEGTAGAAAGGARLVVPAPTGELVTFEVVESPVMEHRLAAAHPEIRTYSGHAVGFPDSIRIDVSPLGFHASVRGDHPSWYVDPAYRQDDSLYLAYFGQSLPAPERGLVEPELSARQLDDLSRVTAAGVSAGPDAPVTQRTYRLALLTDPSYAQFYAAGLNDGTQDAASNAAVLAAKVTLVNRVNEVYEDDLGVRMVLIDDTDKLNLNTAAKANAPGGPCGPISCYDTSGATNPVIEAGCTAALLTRTRLVIGQLVGAGSFDIGHIGLGIDGGGIASVGVVGGNSKAQGCTGLPFPTGDFYAIDYVAHEMGHQFSGAHTFNGVQGSCATTNRTAASSVEPGSGSSVMGYAGICQQDNLQPHSDPYFSQRSQTEIGSYVDAQLPAVNEVDSSAFTGFDDTDAFTITVGGATTAPIVRGTSYTAAGIKAAIETALGGTSTVTVAGYFGGTFGDTGFQVTFGGGALAGTDVPNLVVNPVGFTAQTNDIARGGPPTNGGSSVVTSSNRNPRVTAPPGRTIPIRTPFALTGSATDVDGDPLLYLWEQNDRGSVAGSGLVDNAKVSGPLFRVLGRYADVSTPEALMYHAPDQNLADGNPTRVFPDLTQVLADNTNAETGSCPTAAAGPVPVPVVECYSEFLPTSAYTGDLIAGNAEPSLDFRLTARDQGGTGNVQGGGVDFADVKLRIDRTAGPFQVTSQATPTSYPGGTAQTVVWDVNGTDKPSLAPNVMISFSTDGGRTFPTALAPRTPNDGSQTVRIPAVGTSAGRIKIEAVGNYFFDVNDAPITVVRGDTTAPDTRLAAGPADGSVLLARSTTFGLGADESPVSFACTLDGAPLACPGSAVTLGKLAPGTHRFTAAATDAFSNTDSTPAASSFTVPVDDAALTARRGRWRHPDQASAYLGTVSMATTKGATLQTHIAGARRVALVVTTRKSYGNVKVKLDGVTIGRVSLARSRSSRVVIWLPSFATPASGTLSLVTTSSKKVVIDAVVVTAP